MVLLLLPQGPREGVLGRLSLPLPHAQISKGSIL